MDQKLLSVKKLKLTRASFGQECIELVLPLLVLFPNRLIDLRWWLSFRTFVAHHTTFVPCANQIVPPQQVCLLPFQFLELVQLANDLVLRSQIVLVVVLGHNAVTVFVTKSFIIIGQFWNDFLRELIDKRGLSVQVAVILDLRLAGEIEILPFIGPVQKLSHLCLVIATYRSEWSRGPVLSRCNLWDFRDAWSVAHWLVKVRISSFSGVSHFNKRVQVAVWVRLYGWVHALLSFVVWYCCVTCL